DEQMYAQGIKQELQNNYSGAYNTFQQLVQSYHDSITAVKALIAMLPCIDKITNDTGRYTSLGNYYLSVMQSYPNDTILSKVANELSHKTLIRRGFYPPAITAYETDIQNTTDSLEMLCYQLNIVETYMLIQNTGGNSVQYVGKYKELKPASLKDGFRMIHDLLHHIKSQAKENAIPTVFKLSQNYPNPFNPTTKIDYQLPKSAKVVIKVYDILGKLVKELVNENKEAGFYTVTFDGTNFASGVYFYRINAGDFNAVKKMVLIK
ncbi:MAG: T9SS type A sorting domain-containing protein, partial [Ignavibacteria bacterium]